MTRQRPTSKSVTSEGALIVFRELAASDNRAIGTLVPGKNCGDNCFVNDLQFTLEVPHEQDVWFQTLQETHTLKEFTK